MRAFRMDSLAEYPSLFPAEEGAAAAAMYQGESRFLPLVDELAAAATWRVIPMPRPALFRNLVAAPALALLAPPRRPQAFHAVRLRWPAAARSLRVVGGALTDRSCRRSDSSSAG
jgi:hypothetical protein